MQKCQVLVVVLAVAVALALAVAGCSSTDAPTERLGTTRSALSPADTNLTAAQVNGGSTGAIYRRSVETGVAFDGFVTLPDYVPIAKEQPWIYFGFGTENGASVDGANPGDMEIGFAFQAGVDFTKTPPAKVKPSRWLPYIRRNTLGKPATFFYGKEPATGVTDTITVGSRVHVRVECKAEAGTPVIHMSYARTGESALTERALHSDTAGDLTSLRMPGIDQNSPLGACDKLTMRRVVGIAQSAAYAATDFHRLGPVIFEQTQVTFGPSKSSVTTAWDAVDNGGKSFTDPTAWWWKAAGTVLHGSVNFPSDGRVAVAPNADGDDDQVTMFPAAATGSWSDFAGAPPDGGSSGAPSGGSSSGTSGGGTGGSSGTGGSGTSGTSGGASGGGDNGGGGGGGGSGGGCSIVVAQRGAAGGTGSEVFAALVLGAALASRRRGAGLVPPRPAR